jgi:hypothetical protein
MSQTSLPSKTPRGSAAKVAKWLVERGRQEDAVSVLAAWAVSGPNDAEGQKLLAEALRIAPQSPLCKAAFARMESARTGVAAESPELDAAVAKWTAAELERIEKEIAKPSFNRAQVGFNNNVKYRDHVYHIQTEDSGLNKPHIITHLFADGGRIIKSHKRSYADQVSRPDVALFVRGLMKGQQMEMIIALRDGKFDDIIEGRALGGMELLEHPPQVDVRRLSKKREEGAAAPAAQGAPAGEEAPAPPPRPSESTEAAVPLVRPAEAVVPLVRPPRVRMRLHVMRSLGGGPGVYEPTGDEAVIGRSGAVKLAGDPFCHPSEALLRFRGNTLVCEDFDGGNGVFVRIRTPLEVEPGDEFIIGDQLLRVEKNPPADDYPEPDPTYFYSSPKWPSSFRVVQIFAGGAPGACVVARGTTLQVGSAVGDLVFPDDPLVSEQHCYIEEQAGAIVLTDLHSRTGVFVRIKGETELVHGDEIIVGRTRLLVDLRSSRAP